MLNWNTCAELEYLYFSIILNWNTCAELEYLYFSIILNWNTCAELEYLNALGLYLGDTSSFDTPLFTPTF